MDPNQQHQKEQHVADSKFKLILTIFLILGSLFFLFIGLTHGKSFLIPVTTAIILSMVMNPVAKKLTGWGLSRGLAVAAADLLVVLFIAFMVFLLVAQGNKIAENWSEIEERLKPRVEQAQQYLNENLNIPTPGIDDIMASAGRPAGAEELEPAEEQPESGKSTSGQQQQQQTDGSQKPPRQDEQRSQRDSTQQQSGQEQQSEQEGQKSGLSNLKGIFGSIVKNVFGFMGDMLLILVYIFFFMYYQKKFEDSIAGFAPEGKRDEVRKIIRESAETAQGYLLGRFILIAILAALYFIGYSIIGLEYALFISLIAALFSMLPYVGNFIGLFLAVGMSFLSGGDTSQLVGIVVIFSVAQFVESYILEPFIVGGRVDLNPVVVIVGVVLGGIVWGIMGMILAIPLLGILKVIFDHVESLRPLGYVLDERGISSGGGKMEKVKDWFVKKFKK